ncbi:hypothetical protein B4589_000040 [Halolamina sp. CBA1230]|uniref:DUF7319 domain-containing protein n=1 Tax=Halolamina sp. CBA1230 TaxID=1853690 RepID=UPI0009A2070A|nr:hypothetical protein [Halolamina sp. CBA1230]QKY18835.1 hypothetical protein B4589_000040 [Halolamina sp. CBA1230]
MADPSDDDEAPGRARADADTGDAAETTDLESLREEVEQKYDFDDFGPADMAEMEREEWEAAFDPDTWITGAELIDRVEQDLQNRIATREVFARLERHPGPEGDRLLAYSDEGYAIVNPDGSVEGEGTVLRDVEPSVALCSMEKYEVPTPPENPSLPDPEDVESGSGELGNTMLQLVAAAQILAGIGLVIGSLLFDLQPEVPQGGVIAPVVGILFALIGVFLFTVVANARLSDRFRAEEYRDRLRAVEEAGERPEFVPQLSDDADEDRVD